VRGALLGLGVNLILAVVKAVAGVVSGSAALLADAGHSSADLANNLLVLASQMTVQSASAIADHVRRAVYTKIPEVGDVAVELNTDHVARLRGRLR
jgi:divalent metal cation (Fe/Co/Zn/Cd) transporter